jgi:putative ABC transport system ATP-binding protein
MIRGRGLTKVYQKGLVRALNGLDIEVFEDEFVSIMGPSGCGKSTLLHLIAGLDRPTTGTIEVAGVELSSMRDLSPYRALTVGLIFQLDTLLPSLNASENVQVPMFESGHSASERHRRAEELLVSVGLGDRVHNRPAELSGGERQRVAIARALANGPRLLLADEPTGRLDSENGRRVLDLLERLRRERGLTVVLVTHDADVARRANRIVQMLDGRIAGEVRPQAGVAGSHAAELASAAVN